MNKLDFSTLLNLLIENIPGNDGIYSLSELSRQTDISVNQLGHYKRGSHNNPTYANMVALLEFFNMPMAYLDCTNKVDAMKMIITHHPNENPLPQEQQEEEIPSVRFRNPEGLNLSEEALQQVSQILQWVFAREEALQNGDEEPPIPDFSDNNE